MGWATPSGSSTLERLVEHSRRLLCRSLMVRVNPRLDSSSTICIDDASVTYVAGSTDATLIEPLRESGQLRENCRISNSVAVCVEIASATGTMKTLQTTTETVKSIEVQVSIDVMTIPSRIARQPLNAKLNIQMHRSTRRAAASSPLSPSARSCGKHPSLSRSVYPHLDIACLGDAWYL